MSQDDQAGADEVSPAHRQVHVSVARDVEDRIIIDHRRVQALLTRVRRGTAASAETIRHIAREIALHHAAEEEVVYPRLRSKHEAMVDHSLSEHHELEESLSALRGLEEDDESLPAVLARLDEQLSAHVIEEEDTVLPMLRGLVGPEEMLSMADLFEDTKRRLAAPRTDAPAHRPV